MTYAEYIRNIPDLSVLSDAQLEKARVGLLREAREGYRAMHPYGVPRKLKCAGCQVYDHCNGDDEDCYCECTATRETFP